MLTDVFCSPQRLTELAKRQNQYDGVCRLISRDESDERASHGEAHVIRLKTPSQLPSIEDLVYGTLGNRKLAKLGSDRLAYEDMILLKSDGLPTYHLANVVDDNSMRITHVIRAVVSLGSLQIVPQITQFVAGMDFFHSKTSFLI